MGSYVERYGTVTEKIAALPYTEQQTTFGSDIRNIVWTISNSSHGWAIIALLYALGAYENFVAVSKTTK